MQSHVVATCKNGLCLSQWHHSVFLWPVLGLKSYLVPEKDASVKCLDAVLGKVHVPCWSFIVVRNGPGVVVNLSFCVCGMVMCTGTSSAICSSDESPPTYNHSPRHASFKVSPVGIQYTHSRSLRDTFPFSLEFKSAGVAPCSRKLLDETVKTFAVFFSRDFTFSVVKTIAWCPYQ